jgi:AcrR family transcriptional regulator
MASPIQRRAPRRPYAPRLPPEERREQLLDATLTLIVEQGYPGVSIEAVARLAGVTRPVVYDHFPNMSRLLHALIEREERYAVELLDQILPQDPGGMDPAELVSDAMRQFLEAVASRPMTWRMILLPIDGTPQVIRGRVEENRANMIDRIEALVTWALEQPDMPEGIDVRLAALAIEHLSEQAGSLLLTDPEAYSPERFERFAIRLMEIIKRT